MVKVVHDKVPTRRRKMSKRKTGLPDFQTIEEAVDAIEALRKQRNNLVGGFGVGPYGDEKSSPPSGKQLRDHVKFTRLAIKKLKAVAEAMDHPTLKGLVDNYDELCTIHHDLFESLRVFNMTKGEVMVDEHPEASFLENEADLLGCEASIRTILKKIGTPIDELFEKHAEEGGVVHNRLKELIGLQEELAVAEKASKSAGKKVGVVRRNVMRHVRKEIKEANDRLNSALHDYNLSAVLIYNGMRNIANQKSGSEHKNFSEMAREFKNAHDAEVSSVRKAHTGKYRLSQHSAVRRTAAKKRAPVIEFMQDYLEYRDPAYATPRR